MIEVKKLSSAELKQGHVPCACGEFTTIIKYCATERMPRDYSGEMGPRCSLWVCRIDKLAPLVDGEVAR